ncbi:hypothetical protein D3Z53_16390 [Lachnospiraceae bacterium]|nr:sensor histidine kinase [uncultured Schaedlerella sp.]MCI9152525.1 histidine kinase [Ruminococcus sp.]NBI59599.1 hypothetical protein [Lachnospiraceae bacterium]
MKKNWKEKAKQNFYHQSIATKMSAFMMIIIAAVLVMAMTILQSYRSRTLYEKIRDVSMANLVSISMLMQNTVENVDTYSYICLSNSRVQSTLEARMQGQTDYRIVEQVDRYLDELTGNIDLIESIYIFDTKELLASADKSGKRVLSRSDIREYSWYGKTDGRYELNYYCDDMFLERTNLPAISFSRAIRSLVTMKPIGYMVINVSREMLKQMLTSQDTNEFDMRYAIFTESGEPVINTVDDAFQERLKKIWKDMMEKEETSVVERFGGSRYYVSLYQDNGLVYMNMLSFDEVYQREQSGTIITFLLLILQSLVIFVGTLFVARWYTQPINMLMRSMEQVKRGKFELVEIRMGHYEIQEFVNVYNEMVNEIQNLLVQTRQVERQKRKADLDILNMQIHPHFLYNTFDSIKSLLLLKRYDDAYRMMNELAQFYKINLSKGDDFITIEREVQMLTSYLEIQKMRYSDEFDVIYEVRQEAFPYKILKLVFQPLVENSINHGIHGYTENGLIMIRISVCENSYLKLEVMDNGIGMSKERLDNILCQEKTEKHRGEKSFGLMGTIWRLKYCYGDHMYYEIHSKEKQGTHIILHIPLQEF